MKRVAVRKPSSKSVIEYRRARAQKPTCPSGRELPGTARGSKHEVGALTKTQRRPSRPFGGVLSSPAMRVVMRERAKELFTPNESKGAAFTPGAVCLKIAGRDAGKTCVVTEVIDVNFVKVDGYTRPRKVNTKHLEPTGKRVDLSKAKDAKALQAALAE